MEQVAQSVTGIAHTHGEMTGAGQPKLAPAPMCDYLTGYLAAFGAMLALGRRAREGGSYHVQASLCQSAMFYQRQELVSSFDDAPEQLTEAELERLYVRERLLLRRSADAWPGATHVGDAVPMGVADPQVWWRPDPNGWPGTLNIADAARLACNPSSSSLL